MALLPIHAQEKLFFISKNTFLYVCCHALFIIISYLYFHFSIIKKKLTKLEIHYIVIFLILIIEREISTHLLKS